MTIFGSSWAISAAALLADSDPPSGTHAMSTAPMSPELLLGQQVADVAEVDRVHARRARRERDLLAALRAPRVVTVGPHAGEEDFLDLVLARAVEDERVIQAGWQERLAVARALALRPRQRRVVGVAEGDDVAGDAASGRPDDRLIRIRHDDRVLAAKAHARPPVPGQFHRPILTRPRSPRAYAVAARSARSP